MGRAVHLWKTEDTESSVVYLYGPARDSAGRLSIDKHTGAVTEFAAIPGMTRNESWFHYGMLAKARAEKMIRAQEYPEEAYMAT